MRRRRRTLLSLLLAAALLVSHAPIARGLEEGTGFSDVPAGAWYAGAVAFAAENGLMNGTSAAEFSPNTPTSLAMLVTILHRVRRQPGRGGGAPGGCRGAVVCPGGGLGRRRGAAPGPCQRLRAGRHPEP